jgi:hypothetical protein
MPLRNAFSKLKKSFEKCRNDDDDDAELEVLPRPSRKAALEAAATLERYISVLEESYARKLENLLMSFGHQTRFEETQSMVNTLNTDHFHTNNHD